MCAEVDSTDQAASCEARRASNTPRATPETLPSHTDRCIRPCASGRCPTGAYTLQRVGTACRDLLLLAGCAGRYQAANSNLISL
jgi:hypothetical protein